MNPMLMVLRPCFSMGSKVLPVLPGFSVMFSQARQGRGRKYRRQQPDLQA